jgi:hypothetical protein
MSFYPSNIARCEHIKTNGTQCGSPALRGKHFCYFHKRWRDTRVVLNANRARRSRAVIDMPVLEDAESVQVSLMQIMRLILSGQVEPRTAGLLLYALQTASSNLRRTNFEPHQTRVIIDPSTVDQTVLGEDPWRREDFVENIRAEASKLLEASDEDVNEEASAETKEDSATKQQQTIMQIRDMVTNAARRWGIATQSPAQENQT